MEAHTQRSEAVDRRLARLLEDGRVAHVVEHLRSTDEGTLATQIELSEIAAPPFGEGRRAVRVAELLSDAGLADVRLDDAGNVVGGRCGWESSRATEPTRASDRGREPRRHPEAGAGRESGARPLPGAIVVSAHLDTVFPEGTDVSVTREGDLLRGPGISDDARGLATLVAVARGLRAGGLRTERPLLFAATVGEEGLGDLRGVRHLFGAGGAAAAASGFVSLDGAGLERLIVSGLGSRRFRISARGAGGHSWVDRGAPNPIHALAEVAHRLASIPLPADPATSLTAARWGGGTSINAIPQQAWIELDLRSEDEGCLGALENEVRTVVDETVSAAGGRLALAIESIGSRPGASTPVEAELVQAALAATRAIGVLPELATSSTDANIPMALGVPALTLGCGGAAGKAHTTDEWYRNLGGVDGVLRALYTLLLVAGLEG